MMKKKDDYITALMKMHFISIQKPEKSIIEKEMHLIKNNLFGKQKKRW